MPGPIMTAKQAAKIYGKKYSIREVGKVVMLRNSDGRTVQVLKGQLVYHRTKGKFGIYTKEADQKRRSGGAGKRPKPVGTGRYRHIDDVKPAKKQQPKTKHSPTPAYVAKLQTVVRNHQATKIGECLVDVQSANLMLKIRKKLNPISLKKYDKLSMSARANMAWKMV